MRRKDLTMIIGVAIVAAIISMIVSKMVFSAPKNRSAKIPVVSSFNTALPDVKNDPSYQLIFNSNSLDLAQPVPIGNPNNPNPFTASGH